MQKTKIEWVHNPDGSPGWTFNPITGCLNNCSYCYARKLANGRLKSRYLANDNVSRVKIWVDGELNRDELNRALADPFYPRFWNDRLAELDVLPGPDTEPKRKGIFVCDMSDLFGIGIPEEWTRKVLEVIKSRPHDRFYLLTKQPQNLPQWSPFPDHCYVGGTATDFNSIYYAAPYMAEIQASIKYISFEPLLESVVGDSLNLILPFLNWVIIGAQTKPYKPPKIEWVEEIVKACDKAGVKVFLKDNLGGLPLVGEKPDGSYLILDDNLMLRQEMPE